MSRFFKNPKGAVTVMVSLLLIPAMLVSGTGVDIARIYAGKSIVTDANELAANSVLTQYNALLLDTYGLFAVMEDDPILGEMINEYINVAILGESEYQQTGLGTLQVFYEASDPSVTVEAVNNQNLQNPDVLLRQIEEYAKFRAPIIAVDELITRLEDFLKVKADADVIATKMEVEEGMDDLSDDYRAIYVAIGSVEEVKENCENTFVSINAYLSLVRSELNQCLELREEYGEALEDESITLSELRDMEARYDATLENVRAYMEGGEVGSQWKSSTDEDSMDAGDWSKTNNTVGLQSKMKDLSEYLESYQENAKILVTLCEEADANRDDLKQKVKDLESSASSGDCSTELSTGILEPLEGSNQSLIDQYNAILVYESADLANQAVAANASMIAELESIAEQMSGFGALSNNMLTGEVLEFTSLNFSDASYDVTFDYDQKSKKVKDDDILENFADINNYKYDYDMNYVSFDQVSTQHKEFLETMTTLFAMADDGEDAKSEQEESIGSLMDAVQAQFKKITDFATLQNEGASYYKSSSSSSASGFGADGDWGDDGKSLAKNALNSGIFDEISSLMDTAANKLLLLVYDSEMFSHFATNKAADKEEKSMAGIPYGTDLNYFYQAELEYLYHGDLTSAQSNISSVFSLILLIRFVFNYTCSFTITSVNSECAAIGAIAGPFAIIVQELARVGYALAESVIDLEQLATGEAVPLFKTNTTWRFSVTGGAAALASSFTSYATSGSSGSAGGDGMLYIDYLRIFLLFVDSDTLGLRTSQLIALNITNKQEGIHADESAMSSATVVDMSKMYTDFKVTTQVDMRMLFLSMPFAQQGVDGVIPSSTVTISSEIYRGY